jgi:hypothetical protein
MQPTFRVSSVSLQKYGVRNSFPPPGKEEIFSQSSQAFLLFVRSIKDRQKLILHLKSGYSVKPRLNNWQEDIMSVQRRKYDPGFKRNAVRLSDDPVRSVKEADNPGISRSFLINGVDN